MSIEAGHKGITKLRHDLSQSNNAKQSAHLLFPAFLTLFTALLVCLYWLHRRSSQRAVKRDISRLERGVPDLKDGHLCSPFQAYLGCNALTEPFTPLPRITSKDIMDRLEQNKVDARILDQQITDEPPLYEHGVVQETVTQQWRRNSYPDTNNLQSSYDSVESMRDNATGRKWQRRTMHVHGH